MEKENRVYKGIIMDFIIIENYNKPLHQKEIAKLLNEYEIKSSGQYSLVVNTNINEVYWTHLQKKNLIDK